MVTARPKYRLLLRAELTHRATKLVAHTIEISESLVTVQTDEPAFIGDKVHVQFSFPGLVEPFAVETQVIAQRRASGPGNPGQWTLGFVLYSDIERKRLQSLLSRSDSAPCAERECYRVLLVEDNLLTRDAFSHVVQKFFGTGDSKVLVDIASNGQAAWEMLTGTLYDLAIVDYHLPLLNGDRLIARIRAHPQLTGMPVFAISIDDVQARAATMAAGADLFLPKPVVLRDLFTTLDHLMLNRDAVPPRA